jgi:hypothetical protein
LGNDPSTALTSIVWVPGPTQLGVMLVLCRCSGEPGSGPSSGLPSRRVQALHVPPVRALTSSAPSSAPSQSKATISAGEVTDTERVFPGVIPAFPARVVAELVTSGGSDWLAGRTVPVATSDATAKLAAPRRTRDILPSVACPHGVSVHSL